MLEFIKRVFIRNLGLKITALILALAAWFYIVNELNKGSDEEKQFLNKMVSEQVTAKKLSIRPVIVGKPWSGYTVRLEKTVVVPAYCIVVGAKELLDKVSFAYTIPVDIGGASKSFTKYVPLNPIAPGIYMEETLVQITVVVERAGARR